MANTFTPELQRRLGGPEGKTFLLVKGILAIDTTALGGAAVDDLPASLFGLKKIVAVLGIVNDGEDKNYQGTPDYTGDSLVVGGGVSNAFQDLPNDNYRVTVLGM
jgi:hypothetical protein